MESLFDFDGKQDQYAVMGNPVSHSLSPRIHSEFAAQTRQRMQYTAIQVDDGGFAQAVGNFRSSGGKGLNVTVPFKQEAWRLATARSERAEVAGAVNTLAFRDSQQIFGDNTDGCGLVRDLEENLRERIAGRRVLLVGAGGAARGVLVPLLQKLPAELVIVNRTVDRAEELAITFADMGPVAACGFDDLPGLGGFDLVVNATSASLAGAALPLVPTVLNQNCFCYDMMYARTPTPFLQWASESGARGCADGLGMLVEQAAESFFIWRSVRPQTQPVIRRLRSDL